MAAAIRGATDPPPEAVNLTPGAGANSADGGAQTAAAPEDPSGESNERVWSAVVEIDPGFPFDVVWPGLRGSVFKALRSVRTTWPEMGWQSGADMEVALRQAIETSGSGSIARGLEKAHAEQVVRQLQNEVNCSVQLDREGAAAAAVIAASVESPTSQGQASADDGERRQKIRERIRLLQEATTVSVDRATGIDRPEQAAEQLPPELVLTELLSRLERDVESDERWRALAPMMERALDIMQLGPEAMTRLLGGATLRPVQRRCFVISVDRSRVLASALWPVLAAMPEELRPGRLCVTYRGEEGEDGEGGGGVTRAFLTDAGRRLVDGRLGLLLPASRGRVQLSSLPGFLTPGARDPESVWSQPESWSRFLGRVLGMSVAHECPLGFLLVPSLCRQLLAEEPTFEDLKFVPGLSDDSGVGWYSSLRALLAHRAPGLLGEDGGSAAALLRLDAEDLDRALVGLEAVMPSRAQQIFEALATGYVTAAAVEAPASREAALAVGAILLRTAKTESQRNQALRAATQLLEGIVADSSSAGAAPQALQPGVRSICRALRRYSGNRKVDALVVSVSSVLPAQGAATTSEGTVAENEVAEQDMADVFSASAPPSPVLSGLRALRPSKVPDVCIWLTAGAKEFRRTTGRFYHEVPLDEDFFDPAPQLGWLTDGFEEREGCDGNGVGDDAHGLAADGIRHKSWRDGPHEASWPRNWRGGDVVGFAIDLDAGVACFSLNGEWVSSAQMKFEANGRSFFPAMSLKGRFSMSIPRHTWRYEPPPEGNHQAWCDTGVFIRPLPLPPPPVEDPPPSLEREVSRVQVPVAEGNDSDNTVAETGPTCLMASNLEGFARAVMRKALSEDLQPALDIVVKEFRRVVPSRVLQRLTWQQVQDRVSGRRLENPEAFVQEWREKTTYQACLADDAIVSLWWGFVEDLSAEELLALFTWCTGFASIPVTAWKFRVMAVDDTSRCPTVNTCMTDDATAANRGVKMPTLYLPAYDSKQLLKRKMDWAIAGGDALHLH
eukprot:TRINITY_DN76047_c0_g1_i1.p1 TRINITY_DN76047_c0_g1~~TRINITY_DN76047_c0_g1_i1.p1  ORF type:complete len:1071 (+),score=209.88 TRINITY_DN76047_c0_g1_i1:183-3215(+)